MSRPTARWLVAPPVGRTPDALPPLLPPPGLARRRAEHAPPAEPEPSWPLALVRGVCAGVLTVIAGMLVWSLLPVAAGWRPTVVLTGSMQPRIAPGDVVLAAPVARGQLIPGRVLLFRDPAHPDRTLVHRLVRFDDDGQLITKGDANRIEDSTPVPVSNVLGLPRLRLPKVGLPVVWAHQHAVGALGTAFGVAVLLVLPLSSRSN